MFTKKHFEMFAALIKKHTERIDKSRLDKGYGGMSYHMGKDVLLEQMVEEIVAIFQDSNPRFDVDRFLKAAGRNGIS